MKLHGIHYGMDLKRFSQEYLEEHFGKSGAHFYNIVRGIQHSEVKPDRILKSIAAERTLDKDISQEDFMLEHLERIADTLEGRMKKSKVNAKTITLKLKYSDFTIQTRSKTIDRYVSEKEDFFPIVKELLAQEPVKDSVRLLGISMSKLDAENPPSEAMDEQLEMEF